jgi:hypothetical protein
MLQSPLAHCTLSNILITIHVPCYMFHLHHASHSSYHPYAQLLLSWTIIAIKAMHITTNTA